MSQQRKIDYSEDLKRKADKIAFLIVASEYPEIDIIIEINNLKEYCEKVLPDKLELFDLIYLSRFRRLWKQFRNSEPKF